MHCTSSYFLSTKANLNLYSVVSTDNTLVLHSLSRQYMLGPLMADRYTGISRVRMMPLSLEKKEITIMDAILNNYNQLNLSNDSTL